MGDRSACSRTELESLIGLLNHACKVVRLGRSFLRRMIDLLHAVRPSQPIIRLNYGRLDISAMGPSIQRYFQYGLAPSTQKTYQAAIKRFHTFCFHYNVTQPFPLTEQLLCSFAAYLADQGLAPQTGKSYLSALRNMQISLGLHVPDPRDQSSLPILKRVQAGISRAKVFKGSPPRIRLPITVPILEAIHQSLVMSTNPDKVVFWAVSASAFSGFFRLGELLPETPAQVNPATSLAWGDVAVDSHTNPKMVQFHLKVSKCDQFGAGSDVIVGHAESPLCPVTAILKYIELRGDSPGPFFIDSSHKALSKQRFVKHIRETLNSIGLQQDQYAGHSFRIGAATTAAAAGVQDSTIQTLGRWHSAAFLQYIRTPKEHQAALSSVLTSSRSSSQTARTN